ncbi:hypothetical protein RJ640_023302 [Escallonia rubra]|uniref:Mitochondrial import inner membrane translocase subunit TIM50 n=1 Tax=Escallonia rubra TaxID=112253 RepID=A0AA88UPM8_9ASTE|nr:hypothetical protein RJ640_023302 [Escallonia rubra]
MAELAQPEAYAPRTIQVWRTLLNWLAFFFQIFVQIIRGTPSVAQVLSYVGLRQHSLLTDSPSSPAFKPLPAVELPEVHEPAEPPSPPGAAAVQIRGYGGGDDRRMEKLTEPKEQSKLRQLFSIEEHSSGNKRDNLIAAKDFRMGETGVVLEGNEHVVLDLDETLVCAYETSSLPAIVRNQATEAGLKCFELECLSSDKECEGKPKVNYVTVFERPGLPEFLKQLSEFADLVLFTAGLEGAIQDVTNSSVLIAKVSLPCYANRLQITCDHERYEDPKVNR